MVRLDVSGDEVSDRQDVVAGEVIIHRNVGACGRCVGGCGVTNPVGNPSASIVGSRSASRRAAARTAQHHSARAWREHWPEQCRCQGVEGPAALSGAGAGMPTAGVAGIGPGLIDHHGWTSAQLVMRMS
jgi:hypothetical protein